LGNYLLLQKVTSPRFTILKTAVSGPGSDADLNQFFTQTQQFLTAAQGVPWAQVRVRRLQISQGGHTGLCSAIQTTATTYDAFFSPLQLYGALPRHGGSNDSPYICHHCPA
jgi:hypothetical protein